MNRHFHSLSLIILASFIILFTQSGCRENTLINSKVLPTNATVGVKTYTLPCITHTYYDNFAITSTDIGGIPIYQGVGVYTDPFFGTMTGATFFQLSYGGTPGNPFTGMVVDSAILVLPYSGFTFGDSATFPSVTQTYQVFYMLDSLGNPGLVNYYSGSTKPIDVTNPLSDPVAVNMYNFIVQRDTFAADPRNFNAPGLRIKLRLPALFKYLTPALNNIATSTNLPQDFFNNFNGICVMPANTTQGGPAIPYFQLDGTNMYNEAGILVYYHDPTKATPTTDTAPYVYNFDPSVCSHFNSITRSYSRYPVNNLINSSLTNDSIIVLQNQPGASLDIVIPGILSLPAGVINNAQLQLSLLPGYDTVQLPERLYPVGIGNVKYPTGVGQGIPYNLADRYPTTSLTPLSFMDGFYHNNFTYGSTRITKYTINIPREVMASIAAKNDTIHIHLTGTEDYYGAFKMTAGGGTYHDTLYRPKLFVVYSKLNN